MDNTSILVKNSDINNLSSYKEEENDNKNITNDANHTNDLFFPFYHKFNEIFSFIKDTKENKNDLEDEVDENLIKTLYNLCQDFLNYIKNINDFGNLNLNINDQELMIESYERFVRQCKEYNDNPKVKQLENEISNLLDLLFNNTSEAVNTLFSADSFFIDHVANLKLKLNERNQKIEFEKQRLKKIELEEKVEEFDETFEENKRKNNEMDEAIKKIRNETNKINEKIEKYENYMKKKRKEIDIDFSNAHDCKERIKILEENIKNVERNIKTIHLSPLKIIEKTPYHIIFEFMTPRNVMQFKVNNYELESVQVEISPYNKNVLSYINENIKKCEDISEITYLIKEAIYLNFLDI